MKRIVMFFLVILISVGISSTKKAITFEDFFTMKRIGAPVPSPNGDKIAFTVKEYDIDKNKGQNDIYILDLKKNAILNITSTIDVSEWNPQWSNTGEELAFLKIEDGKSSIFIYDLKTKSTALGAIIPVSVSWFTFSPDNRGFLFTADVPAEGNSIYEKAEILQKKEKNPVKAHVADKLFFRSWNSWRDNLYSHLFFYNFQSKQIETLTNGEFNTPPLDLGGDLDVTMDKKGRSIYYTANKTEQPATNTNNDIFMINLETNQTINITELNEANDNNPRLSPDNKYLAYRKMARPGFEADQYDLILYDIKSGKTTNLTETLDRSVYHYRWLPNSKELVFTVPNHGRHALYKVTLKGKLTLLADNKYLGNFEVLGKAKKIIVQSQAVNMPTELFEFDLKKKSWKQLTFFNTEKLKQLDLASLEEFWVAGANNDSVHVLMVKPPFFDPAKKYPLIVLIHGGPQGAFGDDFHFRWNMQMFAAPGYVVIAPNFHGSRGYGQEFCDAVSKNWGGAPYTDIISTTKYAAEQFEFIDENKIGAAGASYGGFMINWIEGHNPDNLFKCLISHAGVFDQRSMYGATEELWFPEWEFGGTPYENPELFEKYSPSNYVTAFNTPCLVITGEYDFRVPYTQSLQLFTALQKMKVPSRLIVFPDEDHFVQKPQNAKFWWKNIYDWFEKYLK
ncbi:MAG: S9 family peptidase [Calditrichia bacterium]